MLATLYTTAVDLPLHEGLWALSVLWLVRMLCLFAFFQAGCPCCGGATCANCSGTAAAEYQVVLASIAAGTGFSADCTTSGQCTPYNGTFVLAKELGIDGIYKCIYKLDVTATCTYDSYTADQIVLGFYDGTGPVVYLVEVLIEEALNHNGAFPALLKWSRSYGGTPPTCAMSSEAINTTVPSTTGHCNWDGVTVPLVTSL